MGRRFSAELLRHDRHPGQHGAHVPNRCQTVLLTEEAARDPHLVAKIKAQLQAGGNVIMTSGLAYALQDKGLGDLIELHTTARKAIVENFSAGYGQTDESKSGILISQIDYLTNDAVVMVQGFANGNSFPIILSNHYSKGILYIVIVPDNFNDLYSYPPGVLNSIRNVVSGDFPLRLDAPSKVSLFAYDNKTFVVESSLDHPTEVTVSITGGTVAKITNFETGDVVAGQAPAPRRGYGGRVMRDTGPARMEFHLTVAAA